MLAVSGRAAKAFASARQISSAARCVCASDNFCLYTLHCMPHPRCWQGAQPPAVMLGMLRQTWPSQGEREQAKWMIQSHLDVSTPHRAGKETQLSHSPGRSRPLGHKGSNYHFLHLQLYLPIPDLHGSCSDAVAWSSCLEQCGNLPPSELAAHLCIDYL